MPSEARAPLHPRVAAAIENDARRIVVVGARGWIGRTALEGLRAALGHAAFAARIVAFGSQTGSITLDDGHSVRQSPLASLADLPPAPTLLLHLAFLTKDKVAGMAADEYVAANRAVSTQVRDALDAIGVDRLFVASSGAAAFADVEGAAADLRLYGRLKRDDEAMFAAWAEADAGRRRAAIGRLFNVSGPWINKHDTYALASFILDALNGRPIAVKAPMPVRRGYVPVAEMLSLVFAALLAPDGAPVLRFDTGGEAMELGAVADAVARVLDGTVIRALITDARVNDYTGDAAAWSALIARYGLGASAAIDDQIVATARWLADHGGLASRGRLL